MATAVIGAALIGGLLAGCAETVAGHPVLPGTGVGGGPPTAAGPGSSAPRPPVPISTPAIPGITPGNPSGTAPPGGDNPPGSTNPQGGTNPHANPGGGNAPNQPNNQQGAPTSAPSWVKAGMRITFYLISTQSSGATSVWVEDPSGEWQDPKTGKRYRRTDVAGDGTGSASGDGFTQYDIRGIANGALVVTTSVYGIDHLNGVLTLGSSAGSIVTGPNLDGAWLHPDTLAAMKTSPPNGAEVFVGPYDLDGTRYQAISFDITDPNGHQSYTYDTATGLLLAASTRNVATDPAQPGQTPSGANTQLGTILLKGVRTRAIPGQDGANPTWVTNSPQLQWSGTYEFVNPMDPTATAFSYPMTVSMTLGQGAGQWLTYQTATTVQMPDPQHGNGSGVTGPAGTYWYDPAALAGLKVGQVIDKDPVTGETFSVSAADSTTVTLRDTLPGLDAIAVYDRSTGVMLAYQHRQSAVGTSMKIQLRSGPR